jgi:hypothetical protein
MITLIPIVLVAANLIANNTADAAEEKLWQEFRASRDSEEAFAQAALAVVRSRKLLGLTRAEVDERLGKQSGADWFVHVGKPAFMGDRVTYRVQGFPAPDYGSLGLFFRKGKVYACYFGVFNYESSKAKQYHQESIGRKIKLTIN